MNKQELMENYTMEQLADMVADLQKENLVEILKLKNREDTEDVQKVFDAMRLTITELCNTVEDLKCVRTNTRMTNDVSVADFLPTEPIKVADVLINAEIEYEHDALTKAFCGAEKGKYNLFNISELRQIAEHLLVYCNANGGISNE